MTFILPIIESTGLPSCTLASERFTEAVKSLTLSILIEIGVETVLSPSFTSRTDTDVDNLTYSLENTFGNKFSINQNTGQVTLNSSLDYENVSSYNLKVIATDSKGATKENSSIFNVNDVAVDVRSFTENNTNLVGNKAVKAEPSDNIERFYVSENISSEDSNGRKIFNLEQGNLPAGSSYSVDVNDASKYEVDSSGIVRIKTGAVINNAISHDTTGDKLINYLAGIKVDGENYDHEKFERRQDSNNAGHRFHEVRNMLTEYNLFLHKR